MGSVSALRASFLVDRVVPESVSFSVRLNTRRSFESDFFVSPVRLDIA